MENYRRINLEGCAYEVSDRGSVRIKKSNGEYKSRKTSIHKKGYLRLTIGKHGGHYVHRLVGLTFLPIIEGKTFINHKNGIKTDNRVENLEWCNMDENNEHSRRTGLSGECIPCYVIDMNGNIVGEFTGVKQAVKQIGTNNKIIIKKCEYTPEYAKKLIIDRINKERKKYTYIDTDFINKSRKLTDEQVLEIRELWRSSLYTVAKISQMVGSNWVSVKGIIDGRLYASVK